MDPLTVAGFMAAGCATWIVIGGVIVLAVWLM